MPWMEEHRAAFRRGAVVVLRRDVRERVARRDPGRRRPAGRFYVDRGPDEVRVDIALLPAACRPRGRTDAAVGCARRGGVVRTCGDDPRRACARRGLQALDIRATKVLMRGLGGDADRRGRRTHLSDHSRNGTAPPARVAPCQSRQTRGTPLASAGYAVERLRVPGAARDRDTGDDSDGRRGLDPRVHAAPRAEC